MEGHQSEVVQRSFGSAQRCFQNFGCSLDDLDQVVVHGPGDIKDERQGGRALGDVLVCVLTRAKRRGQRQCHQQESALHVRAKAFR